MNLHEKLAELNLQLPPRPKSLGDYIPVARAGDLLFVSGQLPFRDGKLLATGPVPSATSLENAQQAAAQCILNALAAIDGELDGDWSSFQHIARVGVFVASDPGFTEQYLVANGASQLLGKLFGDAGRHARAAVGVPSLPLGASVEVEMTAQLTCGD